MPGGGIVHHGLQVLWVSLVLRESPDIAGFQFFSTMTNEFSECLILQAVGPWDSVGIERVASKSTSMMVR